MKELKNLLRAVVRPFVTLAFIALVWYVAIQMMDVFKAVVAAGTLSGDQVLLLITMVVEFILASVAMIVAFHFGTRTHERREDSNEER